MSRYTPQPRTKPGFRLKTARGKQRTGAPTTERENEQLAKDRADAKAIAKSITDEEEAENAKITAMLRAVREEAIG